MKTFCEVTKKYIELSFFIYILLKTPLQQNGGFAQSTSASLPNILGEKPKKRFAPKMPTPDDEVGIRY